MNEGGDNDSPDIPEGKKGYDMSFRLSGSINGPEGDEDDEPLNMDDMEDGMVKDPIADGIAD